uniref:Uncharacterized protein n=1 Tax=Ascaris lumbricoides TaxID=6252 RepID=A0A9J2NRB0_ASCLU
MHGLHCQRADNSRKSTRQGKTADADVTQAHLRRCATQTICDIPWHMLCGNEVLQSAVGSAGADRYVEDIPNEDANTAQEEAERESGTSEERRLAFIITIGIGCMIVAFLAVMFIAYCIYKGSGCCKLLFCIAYDVCWAGSPQMRVPTGCTDVNHTFLWPQDCSLKVESVILCYYRHQFSFLSHIWKQHTDEEYKDYDRIAAYRSSQMSEYHSIFENTIGVGEKEGSHMQPKWTSGHPTGKQMELMSRRSVGSWTKRTQRLNVLLVIRENKRLAMKLMIRQNGSGHATVQSEQEISIQEAHRETSDEVGPRPHDLHFTFTTSENKELFSNFAIVFGKLRGLAANNDRDYPLLPSHSAKQFSA